MREEEESVPVWIQPIRQDERQTRRLNVPEQYTTAILKVGTRRLVARLVDESSDGFSVILPEGSKRLDEGASVLLRSSSGWHQCNVVYRKPEREGVRIGLQRMGDLPDPRDPAFRAFSAELEAAKGKGSQRLWTSLLVVAVLCGGIVAGLLMR